MKNSSQCTYMQKGRWQLFPLISQILFSIILVMTLWPAVTNVRAASIPRTLPTIAPIAFLGFSQNHWQVFLIQPDGTGLRQLTSSLVDKVHLSWAKNEQRLLANTNSGALIEVATDAGGEMVLDIDTQGMTDAVWSQDGNNVLFSKSIANSIDANDIWLVDIPTRKHRKLTAMRHMQHNPIWSPDEKSIAFLSGAGGQSHDLFVLKLASGDTHQLTAGMLYHFEPAWSIRDEIAFSTNRSIDYEIWICDPAGKRFEQITHSPGLDGQPSWSPDGGKIAFVSSRGGYSAVWIINRDGMDSHQISPKGMRCRGPVWRR
jgi:TolB protein